MQDLSVRRWVAWAALAVSAICATLLLFACFLEDGKCRVGEGSRGRGFGARRLTQPELIHVCLCSDDSDLRAAVVAIKSAYQSAATPELLRFHFVTSPEFSQLFSTLFQAHIPDMPIEVHSDAGLQARLESMANIDLGQQGNVTSPLGLAPFYLDELFGKSLGAANRIILLQTDTVVLGDLAELHSMNLEGHACAAVKTCSKHWSDYVNFEELKKVGVYQYSPSTCAVSLAVLVLDLQVWQKQEVSRKLETWISRHQNSRGGLWYAGTSQAPWLLSIGDDFAQLNNAWGCDGLSRDVMSVDESIAVRKGGFDKKALRQLQVRIDEFGSISPFLATCSGAAKLLHFDGVMTPWHMDRFGTALPVCMLPGLARGTGRTPGASLRVPVFCEWTTFVNCSDLWWSYISEDTSCALKDFDKEWQEMEDVWANRMREHEWKLDAAERDRAKEEIEEAYRQAKAFFGEEGEEKKRPSRKRERKEMERRRQKDEEEQKRRDRELKEREAQMEKEEQARVDQERLARIQRQRGSAGAPARRAPPDEAPVVLAEKPKAQPDGGVLEMSFKDFDDLAADPADAGA